MRHRAAADDWRLTGGEDISALLRAWSGGYGNALDQLTPIVYNELRRLAGYYLQQERPGHSLQATALVNEAYLRLVDYNHMRWENRAHFFSCRPAQLMRRILVDHARRHNLKRGGDVEHVSLDETAVVGGARSEDLVELDNALEILARMDPRKAHVVELRFFGGASTKLRRYLTFGGHCDARLGVALGVAHRDEWWI